MPRIVYPAKVRGMFDEQLGYLRLMKAIVTCELRGHQEPALRVHPDGDLEYVCPRCGAEQ